MKTLIIKAKDIEQEKVKKNIKNSLSNDELVVFPTETVYGIGANALSSKAVKSIFLAKGRPSDNPLIVHVNNQADVYKYTKNVSVYAKPLMNAFWPGPLTLIFENNGIISKDVTGGLLTIAIRIPSHLIARKVIEISGFPICAPSANISGRPSSTSFEHVKEDFYERVSILIDGGNTDIGIESTVLDLTSVVPTILRPGKITKKMIEDILSINIIDHSEIFTEDTPKAPGMKYRHYAPKGVVTLIDGSMKQVVDYINQQIKSQNDEKIAVLCPDEYCELIDLKNIFKLGSKNSPETIGQNLFSLLRLMDKLDMKKIYIPVVSSKGMGQAIMNRVLKAANYNIIKV
ncbi:L-threonylcarbamoyladenylate synthase [Mariniplasma anaerobium]|uniref:Threonylcarbamoyl-AMP synthase n=1 Tax=Mariniplasma anaerobium TaxID=2735436 RepID=A0A7U9TJP9_9MOLU|nr:L-threonylcarbamoyladenylate synthase [Mariniplasma anaerobium]BCR36399.1 threonylcarbamoyl-AMP synthase [Mariniplasma anaerobium]